jgi:hypothetical protein
MSNSITRLIANPRSAFKGVVRRTGIGSYEFRYKIGAVDRPNYAYLIYQAAQLAHRLGNKRVSVLEFGVAGGNGLLAMEHHAVEIEKIFPVGIDIYGFDTGAGLPPPIDYRDLPYHWKPGFFRMDPDALRKRLKRATLVLGDVRDTVPSFAEKYKPAPIGATSQDLDFYSSTMDAFKLFDGPSSLFLPRLVNYFDDVIGGDTEFYNDYIGERAAIHDFNASHKNAKFSPIYYLTAMPNAPQWHHQMWSLHFFDHPQYGQFVSSENQQLPIPSDAAVTKPA